MTREEARIELQAMKDTFEEYEPGGSRCQMALQVALTALRGPTREMVARMRGYWMHKEIRSSNSVTGYFNLPECECSNCGCIVQQEANFCPHCGEPKTDEAVDMMLEKWKEAVDGEMSNL